jgi:hypothetical protein
VVYSVAVFNGALGVLCYSEVGVVFCSVVYWCAQSGVLV